MLCRLTTQITTWSCCHPFCHGNNLLNRGIHTRHSCHLFRHHCKLVNCIWTMPLSLSWCIAFWLHQFCIMLSLSPHHILQFHTTLICIHTKPLILSLHITFQPTQFGMRLSSTHSMMFQYHPLCYLLNLNYPSLSHLLTPQRSSWHHQIMFQPINLISMHTKMLSAQRAQGRQSNGSRKRWEPVQQPQWVSGRAIKATAHQKGQNKLVFTSEAAKNKQEEERDLKRRW